MKDIVQGAVYSAVKLVNKQIAKVICWYVYPSVVDLTYGPKIPEQPYQKVESMCYLLQTRKNYMVPPANRVRYSDITSKAKSEKAA